MENIKCKYITSDKLTPDNLRFKSYNSYYDR